MMRFAVLFSGVWLWCGCASTPSTPQGADPQGANTQEADSKGANPQEERALTETSVAKATVVAETSVDVEGLKLFQAGTRAVLNLPLTAEIKDVGGVEALFYAEGNAVATPVALSRGTVLEHQGKWWLQIAGELPSRQAAGVYRLGSVELEIQGGRKLVFDPSAIPYFVTVPKLEQAVIRFQVQNDGSSDGEAPDVSEIRFANSHLKPQETARLLFTAVDNASAIGRVLVFVREAEGTETERMTLAFSANAVSQGDNHYSVDLVPFGEWEVGGYRVSKIVVSDVVGNEWVLEDTQEEMTFSVNRP